MTQAFVQGLSDIAGACLDGLLRASWQGAVAVGVVFALVIAIPKIPPRVRCWLWRLAAAKLVIALLWSSPIDLPLLPARGDSDLAAVRPTVQTTMVDQWRHVIDDSPPRELPASSIASPVTAAPRFTLADALACAWFAGIGVFTTRLFLAGRRACRLRRGATRVTDRALLAVRDRLSREMNIASPPPLASHSQIHAPLLIGFFRPTIVLPESLVPERIEMLLAHELAHHRRHDLLWAWLPACAGALFFFHPLVWLLRSELARDEESACDADAIAAAGADAKSYGQMLIDFAAAPTTNLRRQFGAAGMIHSSGAMPRRLKMLIHSHRPSHRAVATAAMGTFAVALAGLIPWRLAPRAAAAPVAPATRPAEQPSPSKVITGKVLGADGKPVSGAFVTIAQRDQKGDRHTFAATRSRADGSFSIDAPPPAAPTEPGEVPEGSSIFADVPGVGVAMPIYLKGADSLDLHLSPATTAKLTFLDSGDKPVANCVVHLTMLVMHPDQLEIDALFLPDDTSRRWTAQTDAHGQCTLSGLPQYAHVHLDTDDQRFAKTGIEDVADLDDGEVLNLKPIHLLASSSISGTLLNGGTGKPVAGIAVCATSLELDPNSGWDKAVTDAQGHFHFHRLKAARYLVTLYPNPSPADWTVRAEEVKLGEGAR